MEELKYKDKIHGKIITHGKYINNENNEPPPIVECDVIFEVLFMEEDCVHTRYYFDGKENLVTLPKSKVKYENGKFYYKN